MAHGEMIIIPFGATRYVPQLQRPGSSMGPDKRKLGNAERTNQ